MTLYLGIQQNKKIFQVSTPYKIFLEIVLSVMIFLFVCVWLYLRPVITANRSVCTICLRNKLY